MMFKEIELESRQPLVWDILYDIYMEVGREAHIDLGQFVGLLEKHCCARTNRARTRMLFKLWDEDGNGSIDLFNLVAISEDLGRPLTNKDAKKVISRTSKGKAVTFEEFERLLVRPRQFI